MQVTGMKEMGFAYKGSWDAIFTIIRLDGS